MSNFIVWIIAGGLLGWIASIIMHTNAQQGTWMNIIVGSVGAVVAGWILTPLFGIATVNQNNFSIQAMAISLLGAIILLVVLNFSAAMYAVRQD
jgi:uncharacterized membrane protein YeaQ/YmgE (transglycosylase-associated protein family)